MGLLIIFMQKAIGQGIGILYGALGEILTEKSGNLNLGIPGMMYMGGIAGLIGAFLYENSSAAPNGAVGVLISFLCAFLCAALGGLIYSVLTITLRANQNVTGLALTTFGVGFGNFFGGSLSKLAGGVGQISVAVTGAAFKKQIPVLSGLGAVGQLLFSYGFLTYLAIILALVLAFFLSKTKKGLNLRAVGESPATADAAGINVTVYKYLATCIGGGISGLGGLYFVMEYSGGTWTNNGFGDRGWLAIALVLQGTVGPDTAGIVHYIIQTSQTCDHTSHTGSNVFVPGYVDASRICGIGTFTDRSQMQTGSGMTQNIRCRKRYDHCQIRQESIG